MRGSYNIFDREIPGDPRHGRGRSSGIRTFYFEGSPRFSAMAAKRKGIRGAARHRTVPDPLAARVGARVKKLRQVAEYSFDAFVEETGLGRGYISELERGLVVPTVGALARVARALDVTLADLVIGDTERERLFEELRDASPGLLAALVKELGPGPQKRRS